MSIVFMKGNNYFCKKTNKPLFHPVGWYASEKFDGQRAQWCPVRKVLISRYGNIIEAPDFFVKPLLKCTIPLDGELFMGYGNWHLTGIFRSKTKNYREDLWKKAKYIVFDIPDSNIGTYLERMKLLQAFFKEVKDHVIMVKSKEINSKSELDSYYNDILRRGGEGVMLNNPSAFYHDRRTDAILKLKPVMDDECVIVGYKGGNGRNAGKLGSFRVHPIEDGIPNPKKEFGISGVSDLIRSNYKKSHPIGTILSYSCSDYTKSGKPRHPRYLGKCRNQLILSAIPTNFDCKVKVNQTTCELKKIKTKVKITSGKIKIDVRLKKL